MNAAPWLLHWPAHLASLYSPGDGGPTVGRACLHQLSQARQFLTGTRTEHDRDKWLTGAGTSDSSRC